VDATKQEGSITSIVSADDKQDTTADKEDVTEMDDDETEDKLESSEVEKSKELTQSLLNDDEV